MVDQFVCSKMLISRKAGEDVAKDTPEEEIKLTKSFAAYMEDNQVDIQLLGLFFYICQKKTSNAEYYDQDLAKMTSKGKIIR